MHINVLELFLIINTYDGWIITVFIEIFLNGFWVAINV